ncbi:myosin-10 [Dorcoceras hygrometricum]|uniref:Myosin-10 n=1 Tax=Dorcoceras hygrometricum TaxID=472368 RepID=A0A2Z7CJW8_9LAMI|nr:myosin-10 [Dorcoceras hygrometricum]
MRAAGLASSLRLLLVDIACNVRLSEEATHVSQHFGVLTIELSSCACMKRSADVRQDGRTLDDVQTLRFNEFRKGFLAHSAAATADSMDFRKQFRALNAKVTSLDEQVAATRNDLLEFSAQAQETLNHITDQLSELIAYINRGGNDKKGEVSSSRPQPPPDDQNRGSGNTGGDNIRQQI